VKGPGSYKKGGVYVPPDKEEDMLEVNPELTKSMKLPDDFNASVCLVCGQCQAICPLEIDVNPRLLFRYVLFGLKDKVIENTENIFSCLLCRMCEAGCSPGVHIAENIRALRTYINRDIHGLTKELNNGSSN